MFFYRTTFLAVFAAFLSSSVFGQGTELPIVTSTISDVSASATGSRVTIDLSQHFGVNGVTGQVVQYETSLGFFNIEMLADDAPANVANFLSYVDLNDYDNSIFHRLVIAPSDFIIQGGGYLANGGTVPIGPPVVNEFKLSNTRGTVAMAKLSGLPDSATSQWFINLADNGQAPANLDTQSGGFTVFAKVIGTGMDVVDALADVPVFDGGTTPTDDFSSIPLINYDPADGEAKEENFLKVLSVRRVPIHPSAGNSSVLTFSADANNSIVSTEIEGSDLHLNFDPNQTGLAVVTATATDTNGNTVSTNINVQTLAGKPIFTGHPLGRAVKQGTSVTLQVTAAGTGAIALQWKKDGVDLVGKTSSTLPLTNFQAADAGSYTVVATNAEGTTTSEAAVLSLSTGDSRVVAISTRGAIGTGADILIAGFVLSSGNAQDMLLTGVGPSLTGAVSGFLTDSRITVYQGANPIHTNDDWGQAGNAASIPGIAASVGALSIDYANQAKDAAVLESFSGGVYTAHVSGVNGLTGIGITEAFEATTSPAPGAVSILGISTRGSVGTGADILIGGFVIRGNAPANLVIRGGGPALANQGFTGALVDPQLTLYSGATVITSNDDWDDNPTAPSIASAFTDIGISAYTDGSKDAALFVTLNPGVYTVHLSGVGNLTGVGIVEIYIVP
jgi:cyclophilin family peptidyl-prolyl cis-trans isomerase